MNSRAELYERADGTVPEAWALSFPPAAATLCRLASGEEIRETTLVAVKKPENGTPHLECLAAGKAAQAYETSPDALVFSPLRCGQVASYDAAVCLFRSFLRQLQPGLRFPKPVLCIRMQPRTTQVERVALIEAGIQAGARKVFLYRASLPALRETASQHRELRHAFAIHIEPYENRE